MPPEEDDGWEDAVNVEDEADIRLKLRHTRTALKEMARAAQRDGLYAEQMAELEESLNALAEALDHALEHKRKPE